MDTVSINTVSTGFLLNGLSQYAEDGAIATQIADCLIAEQYSKDTLLALWGEYLKADSKWFETVVCVMYSNVIDLDDDTMRKSLSARIRTRLAAVYDKAGLTRQSIAKDSKGGYNGYSFKKAKTRVADTTAGKFTGGDRTTAKRIAKYDDTTRLDVLAAFLEVAGITSDDMDDLTDIMVQIESLTDK